jgi:hypothetical protein
MMLIYCLLNNSMAGPFVIYYAPKILEGPGPTVSQHLLTYHKKTNRFINFFIRLSKLR